MTKNNNNGFDRGEQAHADKTFAALGSKARKTELKLSGEEREIRRLGDAIRQSSAARPVESDPALREKLIAQMADIESDQKVAKPEKESRLNSWSRRRWWTVGMTTAAAVVVLGWFGAHQVEQRSLVLMNHEAGVESSNPRASTEGFMQGLADTPKLQTIRDNSNSTALPSTQAHLSAGSKYYKDSLGDSTIRMTMSDGQNFGEARSRRGYRPGVDRGGDEDQRSYFMPIRRPDSEQYDTIIENEFVRTLAEGALSTFSIDVDTASYANVRRFLNAGQRPPANAVRIEEMINYFSYDYPQPEGNVPFSVNMEVARCPWNTDHKLLRIGLKGKDVHRDERPVSNLVFLLDVSGSMSSGDKLPLLKRGLMMMVDQLNENDRVSIVTYAGNAGLVLPPTSGDQKRSILDSIERLNSGGSTHGSAGIHMAYQLAGDNFIKGGTNRVLWATDGDLNVGITADQDLVEMVRDKASDGVFLTVLGFGTGNLKDSKLEKIADNGNGVYAYIDSMREAHKVLIEQMSASLVTIAKDVKLQLEFNPAEVKAYRLIGYENRVLATEDFDNDAKDAGDIGAGHTVTALYELVPGDADPVNTQSPEVSLKYQTTATQKSQPVKDSTLTDAAKSGELLTLALRYKLPEANESTRIEVSAKDSGTDFAEASRDFRFAASVAAFGMVLRKSKHRGTATLAGVEAMALSSIGADDKGYRAEFVDLVRRLR